jgi:hypothetical protein
MVTSRGGAMLAERNMGVRVAKGERVVVRGGPPGASYDELLLEPGLVFTLRARPNDGRLVYVGTVVPYDGEVVRCKTCRSEFADAATLRRHERGHAERARATETEKR